MSLDRHEHDTENVDHGDVLNSPNYFGNVLSATMNRREVMRGGLSAAVAAGFAGSALSACGGDGPGSGAVVGTKNVARSLEDRVLIPSDYSASVLFATGDLINAAGGDKKLQDITGDEMAVRAGDHHDGMYYFGLNAAGALDRNGSDRGVIAINFENINQQFLHAAGATVDASGNRTVADEVVKEINAHGVGLIEVKKNAGKFEVVAGSALSRRITPETEAKFAGPVAGSKWVKTKYSTDGLKSRGTLNNCAYGYTPWGTYLTCEENWAGYFDNASEAAPGVEYSRYGISKGQKGSYRWATAGSDDRFARWQLNSVGADASADYRNEANTFGWVVEIDPINAAVTPVKRTTFGRMAHECAYPSIITAGKKFAFYMGDDARFEYVYKFVPNKAWDAADATGGVSAGDKYLNDGVLYVAKYNADGTGTWIPLVAGTGALTAANGFADQAEVLVKTRAAADAVGATKMDRPEWCTVDHGSGDVFITLTNNTNRGVGTNPGVDAVNPRAANAYGEVLRMREAGSDPAATSFAWTIFVFGSPATLAASNLSELTADNDFGSPDGLWADPRGLLWIQTDNPHGNDMGKLCNNQMLVTIPPSAFDVKPVIKRFLVGPTQCELTGIDITPDGKTMFVNIQHPGEDTAAADVNAADSNAASKYSSAWPYDRSDATKAGTKAGRPRSATLVITKKDGGVIGF
ncbi:PhoX family phosphatase [Stagnimonas aquatica]|uniref:PhoX family phosphatase n=1 Tax=Stagnimonas aquatica TaxID=2689987 RepID=A0A3N0VKI0_9GAMM|nr:PhoX family phosphatase [Stagnimonas aquatica]ROH93210.1 PhoX family phosphatase [Stagnimonas aquatica]